jgi:VWFA-related protein
MTRGLAAFFFLIFLTPGGAQTAKFKAQSSAVVVDVIVTDSKGNVVPGLTASDFRVFENDASQTIVGFEAPASIAVAVPTTSSPTGGAVTPSKRAMRFVTLVVDVGDVRPAGLQASISAATQFVEKVLGAGDYAGIYSIGSNLRLVVPFTQDKSKLAEGLQSLTQRSNDGTYGVKVRDRDKMEMNNLRQQEDEASEPALKKMIEDERMALQSASLLETTFQARAVFVALRAIAQSVSTFPGRKNVIVFSEGFAHSPEAGAQLSAVVDAANRANVAVYVVDPGGITGVKTAAGGKAESAGSKARGRGNRGQIYTGSDTQELTEAMGRGSRVDGGYTMFDVVQRIGAGIEYDDLQSVAEATGGFLIKDQNSLLSSLERIDRDSRDYYTLTYQTQNQSYDGAFRKIKVALGNSGYKLRYRKGYWAIAPGEEMTLTPAAAQLLSSAASGGLKATIPARMNASLQLGTKDDFYISCTVWIKGDASALVKTADGYTSGVTLVVVGRNAQGELVDVAQRSANLRMDKNGVKEFERSGMRLTATLRASRMEPMNLQAVAQFSNGSAAAGKFDLVTPGSAGAHATSLLLTQRVDAAKPPVGNAADPLRVGEYELVLPSQNVFTAGENLTLYFGVDDVATDAKSGNPNLKVNIDVKSGGKVVKTVPADTLYPFPDSKSRVFFLNQFPMAGLSAGGYSVEVTVEDKAQKTRSVRTAEFTIQ